MKTLKIVGAVELRETAMLISITLLRFADGGAVRETQRVEWMLALKRRKL